MGLYNMIKIAFVAAATTFASLSYAFAQTPCLCPHKPMPME